MKTTTMTMRNTELNHVLVVSPQCIRLLFLNLLRHVSPKYLQLPTYAARFRICRTHPYLSDVRFEIQNRLQGDLRISYINSHHTGSGPTISDMTTVLRFAGSFRWANLCIVVTELLKVIVVLTKPVPQSFFSDLWYFSRQWHNWRKIVGVRIVPHHQLTDVKPKTGDCK